MPYRREQNLPYYPVPREENRKRYNLYLSETESLNNRVLFAGRLADYKYYNMDQAVARALGCSRNRLPKARDYEARSEFPARAARLPGRPLPMLSRPSYAAPEARGSSSSRRPWAPSVLPSPPSCPKNDPGSRSAVPCAQGCAREAPLLRVIGPPSP
jgi:UDP-galactopyranose mutase